MTESIDGVPGRSGEPAPELDPTEQRLAALLDDLADDPDAPPSVVTADSVLAAVRAQARPAETAGPARALDVSDQTAGPRGRVMDGRKRFHRRRVLVGVLAAACVVGVGAVVIPLSLRSSDTTTSAESAVAGDRTSTAFAGRGTPEQSAADQSAAAGSAQAPVPEAAASGLADAALPGQSPAPATAGADAASSPACTWSPLSATAASALTGSLPPDRFGAPGQLIAGCAAEPVAGARLSDATGGSLVVTVVTATPGACASGSSNLDQTETGVRCVSQGSGRYLATDAGGAQTAYVYADGLEVAVGKDRSTTGLPEGDPLTADQLLAAAQAVLGAQG